jgi:hypothetical protein
MKSSVSILRIAGVCCVIFVLGSGAAAAQTSMTASPRPGDMPPVLSTVPSPPAGAMPQPGQMSGLPLQVGDLPPGIVAVRVIRRSFAENIADQPVELRVARTNQVLKAATGAGGRAQFDAVAVGETVRVRAVVDGEILESQDFTVPALGGVRLVLVAGVSGAPGAPAAGDMPAPTAVAGTFTPPQAPAPLPGEPLGVWPVFAGLFAIVGVLVWRWRSVPAGRPEADM